MLRNAKLILLAGAFVATAGLMMAADIPNNFLELDGNSVVNTIDDWNLLNGTGACTSPGVPAGCGGAAGGSLARSFISGAASIEVFAGGGSKDPSDISQWKWKSGGTPDKDAITNGYAAAYQSANGHLMLEFGADRFAVNGDANIGFWFFQQDVHPTGAGTGGGSPFSGVHVNNDIFVVSAFTQGGGVSTITVYVWDGACGTSHSGINAIVNSPAPGDCAESNLRLKFASTPSANCIGIAEGCAIVNSTGINVGWPYLAKFGVNSTTIPQGGFYEGGLDVSSLLGGNIQCFTSFLIETRTSATASSVLKDFVAGTFNICSLAATKSCPNLGQPNASGTAIDYHYTGTVTNTGIGGLSDVILVETPPTGSTGLAIKKGGVTATTVACPTDAPTGSICADLGPLAAGAVANYTVDLSSTSTSPTNNAYAFGKISGSPVTCQDSGAVCSSGAQATCSASANNDINVSKSCGVPQDFLATGNPAVSIPGTVLVTSNSLAAVKVNFSGTITNNGQAQLSNVTISDSPANATLSVVWPGTAGVLAPGQSAKYTGSYLPSGVTLGDVGSVNGRYLFSDEVKITGATPAIGNPLAADASCVSTFSTGAQACASPVNGCNICDGGHTCAGN